MASLGREHFFELQLGRFRDVEIDVYPASSTAAEREASERELRRLAYELKSRDPQARRLVANVLARLGGASRSTATREWEDLDTGSPRADAIAAELLEAGRAG
jgi:hypothetical protein